KATIEKRYPDILPIATDVGFDASHGTAIVQVRSRNGAATRLTTIDYDVVDGADWQEALSVEADVRSIAAPPYVATERDAAEGSELGDSEALFEFVDKRGRRGIEIQRFKGLGEMNAQQLWETTMNPDARVLRQVTIQDAVETDQLFSVLMGD